MCPPEPEGCAEKRPSWVSWACHTEVWAEAGRRQDCSRTCYRTSAVTEPNTKLSGSVPLTSLKVCGPLGCFLNKSRWMVVVPSRPRVEDKKGQWWCFQSYTLKDVPLAPLHSVKCYQIKRGCGHSRETSAMLGRAISKPHRVWNCINHPWTTDRNRKTDSGTVGGGRGMASTKMKTLLNVLGKTHMEGWSGQGHNDSDLFSNMCLRVKSKSKKEGDKIGWERRKKGDR